ncbi:hypothetical protein [Fredinandcohnia sp. 179-A 10B2 NHS]|uniref:hypothetical protein n=1 Tax=Fredinandcohnia sp. 179-A 10B2 NHS TaxID=3235176 RepID=UPI0039A0A258
MGSKYQTTVRNTIFDLESPASFWIEELKKKNGDVLIERFIGELISNAHNFTEMGSELRIIGDQLLYLSSLYADLRTAINNVDNDGIVKLNRQIEVHRNFIIYILKKTDNTIGENQLVWYKELSNYDSKTSNLFMKELKEFERNKED